MAGRVRKFWRRRKSRVPNPGSRLAAQQGCDCPIGMNNNGEREPKNGWIVREGCLLHGQMETRHIQGGGGRAR